MHHVEPFMLEDIHIINYKFICLIKRMVSTQLPDTLLAILFKLLYFNEYETHRTLFSNILKPIRRAITWNELFPTFSRNTKLFRQYYEIFWEDDITRCRTCPWHLTGFSYAFIYHVKSHIYFLVYKSVCKQLFYLCLNYF